MIIRDLFKTVVLEVKLDLNLKNLKNFCLNYKKENKTRRRSNPTGYQSHDVLKFIETKELQKKIIHYSNIYLKDILQVKKEPNLNHMWFNMNFFKDYNRHHCHPENKISGVFYVSTPKNCGNIIFINSSPIEHFLPLKEINGNFNNFNSTHWFLPPLENYLYIFPSWLYHHVEPNLSKKPRITFSFNVN